MPTAARNHPSYKNNLIFEAACEVRFEPGQWDPTVYGRFLQKVPDFTGVEQVPARQVVGMPAGRDVTPQLVTLESPTRFALPDGSRLYQIGREMFSASIVGKYTNWEEFLALIDAGFQAYNEIVKPRKITRVGLRYINRLEQPEQGLDFRDWFAVGPLLPDERYPSLGPYFVRLEMPQDDFRLIVTTGTGLTEKQGNVALFLDLDQVLIRELEVSWETVSDVLRDAHERVWQAFVGFCTPRTVAYMEGE